MAHFDHFLRQVALMELNQGVFSSQEPGKALMISNKELPGISEWENGKLYDITITYRRALQVQKIFTDDGDKVTVILKVNGKPVYEGKISGSLPEEKRRSRYGI